MRKAIRNAILTSLSLVFLLATGTAYGQGGASGTILGTVTDISGAVIPNAKVTITNTGTGITHVTETTGAGDYAVPDLVPGPYRVDVEATGFSKAQVGGTTLQVAQQVRVNVTLQTGAATETIKVTSGGVALDTDTSEISQIVTQKQVDQLPLNGRNFINLLFITAGAVQTTGEMGQMRSGEGNAISIDGARPSPTTIRSTESPIPTRRCRRPR